MPLLGATGQLFVPFGQARALTDRYTGTVVRSDPEVPETLAGSVLVSDGPSNSHSPTPPDIPSQDLRCNAILSGKDGVLPFGAAFFSRSR
jgi:hypothetical protein